MILYKIHFPCQKVCDALNYVLDNTFIRFGSKFHRQIVGFPRGTNFPLLLQICFCLVIKEASS